jgi:hypothetical protein
MIKIGNKKNWSAIIGHGALGCLQSGQSQT